MLKPTFTQRFGPCPEGVFVERCWDGFYRIMTYNTVDKDYVNHGPPCKTLDEAENALSFWKAGW